MDRAEFQNSLQFLVRLLKKYGEYAELRIEYKEDSIWAEASFYIKSGKSVKDGDFKFAAKRVKKHFE